MPRIIAIHEVDDAEHWLASSKRDEIFKGVASNIVTFVHRFEPNGSHIVGRFQAACLGIGELCQALFDRCSMIGSLNDKFLSTVTDLHKSRTLGVANSFHSAARQLALAFIGNGVCVAGCVGLDCQCAVAGYCRFSGRAQSA